MKFIFPILLVSMFLSPVLDQKPIPSKTFSRATFAIDRNHVNIILSNIKVTIFADVGVVSWSLSADQDNRTHALGLEEVPSVRARAVPRILNDEIDKVDSQSGALRRGVPATISKHNQLMGLWNLCHTSIVDKNQCKQTANPFI